MNSIPVSREQIARDIAMLYDLTGFHAARQYAELVDSLTLPEKCRPEQTETWAEHAVRYANRAYHRAG